MAEAARPRPIEYRSPRPYILALCFVWGVGIGFALNFFRPPDELPLPEASQPGQTITISERVGPSELERRRLDAPNISEVAPAPEQPVAAKPSLENMTIEPPPAVLTTEGGLTGKTAPLVFGQQPRRPPGAPTPTYQQQQRPAAPPVPPPLPDLMP